MQSRYPFVPESGGGWTSGEVTGGVRSVLRRVRLRVTSVRLVSFHKLSIESRLISVLGGGVCTDLLSRLIGRQKMRIYGSEMLMTRCHGKKSR
ncbi:hypothetical protein GE061_007861 [Apolygus lucorum]|uniref:Uncharacterized protein n=1 Tax=Apolygus lucorum TaxID=248454 RepID=A0A8S9WPG6_APOLU|nr:hypothetical protein GE061_007861 [Apolygus lucorum]